jgi:hypothetical protein
MFKQALKMTSSSQTCLITGEKVVGNSLKCLKISDNSYTLLSVSPFFICIVLQTSSQKVTRLRQVGRNQQATKEANIRSPNMSRKAAIELLAVGVIVPPCWMKIPLVVTKRLVGEFSQITCLIKSVRKEERPDYSCRTHSTSHTNSNVL